MRKYDTTRQVLLRTSFKFPCIIEHEKTFIAYIVCLLTNHANRHDVRLNLKNEIYIEKNKTNIHCGSILYENSFKVIKSFIRNLKRI